MIKLLHIENIAVIERCDIEFDNGFNVLTGETGAGKSIIIDAIGAVLGYRTHRDVIRSGAQKAAVSAVFCDCSKEALEWLSKNGFETDDEDVIVSREISIDGKSSARINGRPVSATLLREFGILLINILGQHDSQQLLDSEMHAVFIDRFASHHDYIKTFETYSAGYEKLQKLKQELSKLDIDEASKARQVEMLKFQIDELSAANLVEGEDVELLEKQKLIRDSAKVIDKVCMASSAFSGDNDFAGICGVLSQASKAMASISDVSERMSVVSDKVSELYYLAEDVSGCAHRG